jgi:hypothetical protein
MQIETGGRLLIDQVEKLQEIIDNIEHSCKPSESGSLSSQLDTNSGCKPEDSEVRSLPDQSNSGSLGKRQEASDSS